MYKPIVTTSMSIYSHAAAVVVKIRAREREPFSVFKSKYSGLFHTILLLSLPIVFIYLFPKGEKNMVWAFPLLGTQIEMIYCFPFSFCLSNTIGSQIRCIVIVNDSLFKPLKDKQNKTKQKKRGEEGEEVCSRIMGKEIRDWRSVNCRLSCRALFERALKNYRETQPRGFLLSSSLCSVLYCTVLLLHRSN